MFSDQSILACSICPSISQVFPDDVTYLYGILLLEHDGLCGVLLPLQEERELQADVEETDGEEEETATETTGTVDIDKQDM